MTRRGKIILFLWALVSMLSLGRMVENQTYDGPGSLASGTPVVIPSGSTKVVAVRLKAAGVIRHPWMFEAAAWLTRGKFPLRSGEFWFPAKASLHQVLDVLRFAPEVEHKITVPGGLTSIQIAAIINNAPDATGSIAPPPEGSILPQTYAYLHDTTRRTILNRMEKAMRRALAKAWVHRAPGLPLQTPEQALVLASIVQQETPLPAELPRIASVYENRLVRKMKLQADPTVIYAVTHGAQTSLHHPVDAQNLRTGSPYNTYLHRGLPPGPICSPDLDAINAVLHPASTEDIYFVATGKGGHVFARNFKEQLANIGRYQALRNQQRLHGAAAPAH